MRTIRLNGELGKKFGRIHKLDVNTPAEAIRALCANHPEFRHELISASDRGIGYRCVVDREVVSERQIPYPMSRTFSVTPVVQGAGKALGIILGVALLAVAVAATGGLAGVGIAGVGAGTAGAATMATGIGFLGLTYGSVALMGVGLILGGISQMMAPTPTASDSNGKTNENQYFNGAQNTTAQGATVPIGYGRAIIGSAVISASVSVEQQADFNQNSDYLINGLWGGKAYF